MIMLLSLLIDNDSCTVDHDNDDDDDELNSYKNRESYYFVFRNKLFCEVLSAYRPTLLLRKWS